MQGRREIDVESKNRRSAFDNFGSSGSMFQHSFRGRVPFDDPFFTSPFGRASRSDMFRTDNHSHLHRMQRPVIEEMDSDDEQFSEKTEGNGDGNDGVANSTPIVEHPDDQEEDEVANHGDKGRSSRRTSDSIDDNNVEISESKTHSMNFQRVSYGGINGMYYTATTSRTTSKDGMTFEERREADITTGEATHKISRGIHQKGHSVTRKLDSSGKVDTVQTLHNINEDELAGFDQAWEGSNGGRHGEPASWGCVSGSFSKGEFQ